jgi:hypothetical protein
MAPPSPENAAEAVKAKETGNECIKAKQFDKAVTEYSRAISLDSSQAAFFSNRALALQKLGRYTETIADCDAAIALEPNFYKAYYYKADAYSKLGINGRAASTASKALKVEGLPERFKAPLEKIIANGSKRTPLAKNFVQITRIASFFMAIFYLIPMPIMFTLVAYRMALYATFATLVFKVYTEHGKPWGMAFVQRILNPYEKYLDYNVHRIFFSAILIVGNPFAIGLIAVMALDMCEVLFFDLPRLLPTSPGSSLSRLVHQKLLPKMLTNPNPNQNITQKWMDLRNNIMGWTALLELLLVILLTVQLFTPSRSLLQTILLWQLLRTVSMFCRETRLAFSTIDHMFRKVVARVPALAANYDRFSKYVASWGDLPQQPDTQQQTGGSGGVAGAAQGFMQRATQSCNIM